MASRLVSARPNGTAETTGALYPFPEEMCFRISTCSNPRRLVKSCFRAIGQADSNTPLPFTEAYLHRIEEELYPDLTTTEGQSNG